MKLLFLLLYLYLDHANLNKFNCLLPPNSKPAQKFVTPFYRRRSAFSIGQELLATPGGDNDLSTRQKPVEGFR